MTTNRIVRALMITAMMMVWTTIAEAQRATVPALESNVATELAAAGQKSIVGSWLDTVSVTDGPTFNSLSTHAKDGSSVFNDQGSVITGESFPHVFSAGHGVWVHRGGRTFSHTALQLISDLEGNLLFRNKIRQTVTLSRSGDAYRAVWRAEFTDPAGNPAVSFEGTTEGRRIKAEPLR